VIESVVLPEGIVRVTGVVQLVTPHAGIFTVVVEIPTAENAACTSVDEQLAALMTCA
jgi:hypothetical protein